MKYLTNMPSTTSAQSSMAHDRKPEHLTSWQTFKKYIYNKESRTCCNRTGKNWCLLLTFYILFTCFVFALFLALLLGVVTHIRKGYQNDPWFMKIQIQEYANPGLSFVPNIVRQIPSPIIWYMFKGEQDVTNMKPDKYIEYLDKYLKKYEDAEEDYINNARSQYVECNAKKNAQDGEKCLFAKSSLGLCGKDSYGYNDETPCFYLKVNKLLNWVPEAYDDDKLQSIIPDSLRDVIQASEDKDVIWVACHGLTPMDTENLGDISYFPQQGFPFFYYPVTKSKEYLVPLVAVRLNNLKQGYLVTILCSMFAKNINHGVHNDQVKISFYVDNDKD